MKIATFVRIDSISSQIDKDIRKELETQFEFTEENPDIVIPIGGDGTFKDAVRLYGLNPCYVGVNTGHLGFYVDFKPNEVGNLINFLKEIKDKESLHITKLPIVLAIIKTPKGNIEKWAINDMSFRHSMFECIECDVHINNKLFESFLGDTLVISTPMGSSAFNKSLGGAIIDPEIEAIQLTEVAGVNNGFYNSIRNSILIPKGKEITFSIKTKSLLFCFDNEKFIQEDTEEIMCKISDENLKIINFKSFSFWERIRTSFIER